MAVMKIRGEDGKFYEVPSMQGTPGATPSITIGTVETLPADSPATAEITGDTPNLTLNMGIPQGSKGPTGLGVPTPTPEDAGKFPMVNQEGNGYILWEMGSDVGEWELFANITIEEAVSKLTISQKDNGGPFSYNEIFFRLYLPKTDAAHEYWVNGCKVTGPKNTNDNYVLGYLVSVSDTFFGLSKNDTVGFAYGYGNVTMYSPAISKWPNKLNKLVFDFTNFAVGATVVAYGR